MENTTNWLEKYSQNSIAKAWIETGGSFLKNIGEALLRADSENCKKIIDTFGQYVINYEPQIKYFQRLENLENEPKPMISEGIRKQKRKRYVMLKITNGGSRFGFDIDDKRKNELAEITSKILKSCNKTSDLLKSLGNLKLTDTEYAHCMFAVIKSMNDPIGGLLEKILKIKN